MIVRNEAEHLERCLRSVADLVDEMIVCDTGSTDGTIELAESLGARVIHFPGAMTLPRPATPLKPAKGDVIFTIDADEYLSDEARANFRREIATLKPGHVMTLPILSFFDPDNLSPALTHHSEMVRIFWNQPNIQWHRPVHVQVIDTQTGATPPVQHSHLTTHHLGYLPKVWQTQNKRSRLSILERLVRDESHLAHNHFFLAKFHFVDQQFTLAAECAEQAIALAEPGEAWLPACRSLHLGALLQCGALMRFTENARRAHTAFPDEGELQFHRAVAEFHSGNLKLAEEFLRDFLAQGAPVDDATLRTWKADYYLGRISLLKSLFPEALKHFAACLQFAPTNEAVVSHTAEALALTGKTGEARRHLSTLNSNRSRQAQYVECLCLLAERRNEEAIPLLEILATDEFRTRSVLLYLGLAHRFTGQFGRAESAFRRVIDRWPEDDGVRLALLRVLAAQRKAPETREVWKESRPGSEAHRVGESSIQRAGATVP